MKIYVVVTSLFAFSLGVLYPSVPIQAQSTYPTSSEITATPLDQARRDLLQTVLDTSIDALKRHRAVEKLCPITVSQSPLSDQSAQRALPIVEHSLATELLFERPDDPLWTGPRQFSFLVEFSLSRVFLQHNQPRYRNDASGQFVMFPSESPRGTWLQGKLGTDMFVLVPAVRECGVQAVVLCPRMYKPHDQLIDSKFVPKAGRVLISAKADGLFSAPPGMSAKVVASLLGTKDLVLPAKWSNTSDTGKDPAVTITFATPRVDQSQRPAFAKLALPWLVAFESRVDFGQEATVFRTSYKKTMIEVSEFSLQNIASIPSGNTQFSVESGPCFLLSQWSESSL